MLWVSSVVVAALVGWLTAAQVVTPEQIQPPEAQTVTVEVTEQSIRLDQPYIVNVQWSSTPVGINGYAGTLTSVELDADPIDVGDVLYTVGLQPAIAARGEIPAFRDLDPGARGDDVVQLQRFLIDLGYFDGDPTGVFDAMTTTAVLAWSEAEGFGEQSGVPRGRIMFLPELPAHLDMAEDARVGMDVVPGQQLAVLLSAAPRFSLPVLEDAVTQIQPGMRVEIPAGDETWHAQVTEIGVAPDGSGALEATLGPLDEDVSICGVSCGAVVEAGERAQLQGTLILVPETTGAAVPTAAIRADALGATSVMLADETEVSVTVVASANGLSIVEGVDRGQIVIVRSSSPSDDSSVQP